MKGILCLVLVLYVLATQAQRTGRIPETITGLSPQIAVLLDACPHHQLHTQMGGVRLELRGIYVHNGLLWFVFRGDNYSPIDFQPATMRISIRDKHALKRRASQERPMTIKIKYEPTVVSADSYVSFCYALVPRIPGRREELFIEWMERNGDRRLSLRVPASAVLTAQKIVASAPKN